MFGFGFTKLVVLISIIVAIWYGFKYVGQVDRARKRRPSRPTRRAASGGGGRTPEVEETVQCRVCGAYVVAKSASPCERPDCPY